MKKWLLAAAIVATAATGVGASKGMENSAFWH